MKKSITLLLVLVLGITLLAACGGGESGGGSGGSGGDVLKGTWEGTNEDGDAAWTFDGKSKCTLTTYFLDKAPGAYTLNSDTEVEIKLDAWSEATIYTVTISGNSLTLKANDPYSPNYELTKK